MCKKVLRYASTTQNTTTQHTTTNMSRCRPTLQRLWPSPSMGRAAAPSNHGAAAPQHHAQAASRRACVRCCWFACLEGQKQRDQKIEGGGGAWALNVAIVLQIKTQQSHKIDVSNGGGVREDARLGRNAWGCTVSSVRPSK